jgi:predicted nucleotidyltransferase
MSFQEILNQHELIQKRKRTSQSKLQSARELFAKDKELSKNSDICIFAAGSLGRLDSGATSDLDIFVTTMGKDTVGRLDEILYFSSILRLNTALGYEAPSNDGEFLKIFHVSENEGKVGSAKDDIENWFTTRMLLLLESTCIYNDVAYHIHKKAILDFYFRDSTGQDKFRPVFLLNDILRYWRTLCLNYEQKARTSPSASWKKKNFNLKFSRLLSVFGTILPLIMMNEVTAEKIELLSSRTPMERLAEGLDALNAPELLDDFLVFLDHYEFFLMTKETTNFSSLTDIVKTDLQSRAGFVSDFIFRALNHQNVPIEFRRYLVI